MGLFLIVSLLFTLPQKEISYTLAVNSDRVVEGIEKLFGNNLKRTDGEFELEGEIPKEEFTQFILPTKWDSLFAMRWIRNRVSIKIKVEEESEVSTSVLTESRIEGLGLPMHFLLLPPTWIPCLSNGRIERIILQALEKEITEGEGKELIEKFFPSKEKEEPQGSLFSPFPFSPNIDIITPMQGKPDNRPQNESAIKIIKDRIYAGWNDTRDSDYVATGFSYSIDKGDTWAENILVGLDAGDFPYQCDPCVDGIGDTIYFSMVSYKLGSTFQECSSDVYIFKSTDGGVSWDTGRCVYSSPDAFEDKPWITVVGDTVYCTFASMNLTFLTQRLLFVKSMDKGKTFSSPVVLNNRGNGSIPKQGPDGEIYVVWTWDVAPGKDFGIRLRKSIDGGQTWGPKVLVGGGYYDTTLVPWRCHPLPSMAVDKNNGNIYVVFHSADEGYNDFDVFLARSTNHGASFEPQVQVNDCDLGNQFMPWVAVDSEGTVHIIWYDTRAGDDSLDVYYACSTDYGKTFSSSIRVTEETRKPYGGDIYFIGDYIGLDVEGDILGAVWAHPKNKAKPLDIWFAKAMVGEIGISEKKSSFKKPRVSISTPSRELNLQINLSDYSSIEMNLYSPLGRRVKTLYSGKGFSGTRSFGLSPGIYFLEILADGRKFSKKIVLVK